MSAATTVLVLMAIGAAGYALARRRALASVAGDTRRLHSLPVHYGAHVAIMALAPSVALLAAWTALQPVLVERWAVDRLIVVSATVEAEAETEAGNPVASRALAASGLRGLVVALERVDWRADGAQAPGNPGGESFESLAGRLGALAEEAGVALHPETLDARHVEIALETLRIEANGRALASLAALAVAFAGLALSLRRIRPEFRARVSVERAVIWTLAAAASIAILATVGIALSMLFETMRFFGAHDWKDFFFGSTWAPNFRGDSALSFLPLLWGTLYVSLIALFVAVPLGLYAAIYLSEYASARFRAVAKPMIEILAGIPTIVYGLFALLTVGPMLVRVFGEGDGSLFGLGWMKGATSALTAGVVMGVMLVPFVSSLSDDIIGAVPKALRDGSLGLGATRGETIRQVVLPAALPGIVGAILLAASRAIGETMIVVLGAGAVARFSLNPLESMTTITTRIVSQLTGDTDFGSAETLVAFALGITLFALTLCLNAFALYVVRRYREQYE